MIDAAKLRRINNILDVAIGLANTHESSVAAARFLSDLQDEGITPGEVMLIAQESPIHEQLLEMRAAYLKLLAENERLRTERLAFLVEQASPRQPPQLPTEPSSPPGTEIVKSPPPPKRSVRFELTRKHCEILVGLQTLEECTVRQLSFHLYGKPDTNTVLDDAMKTLLHRKLIKRRGIDSDHKQEFPRSRWVYSLTEQGLALAENIEM